MSLRHNKPAKKRCRRKQKTIKDGQEECCEVCTKEHQQHSRNHIKAHNRRVEDP